MNKESVMKKKKPPAKERNYLVKLALFRKAGSHKKSNKALRKNEKQKGYYNDIFATGMNHIVYNSYCNALLIIVENVRERVSNPNC
jgi:hypothetical protein